MSKIPIYILFSKLLKLNATGIDLWDKTLKTMIYILSNNDFFYDFLINFFYNFLNYEFFATSNTTSMNQKRILLRLTKITDSSMTSNNDFYELYHYKFVFSFKLICKILFFVSNWLRLGISEFR